MSRVVLVALQLAWCAARGDEYAVGALPQYGGLGEYGREDYRARSPDAPAPLDYKYEEEPHGDTDKPPKYIEETDRWRKLERKQRPHRDDPGDLERDLEPDADETPKPRSNRRHSRHKERGRGESARRRSSYRGSHDDSAPDYDYRGQGKKYRDDDDHDDLRSRATTARIIRRKPRDRMYVPPAPSDTKSTLMPSEDEEPLRPPGGKDEWVDMDNMLPGGRGLGPGRRVPGPPDIDTDTDIDSKPRIKSKYRNYQDYGEYYDMKRVNSIQNKLPQLLRRTTVMRVTHTGPAELVQALWPSRRSGGGPEPKAPPRTDPPLYMTTVAPPVTAALDTRTKPPPAALIEDTLRITTTAAVPSSKPPPPVKQTRNLTELSIAEKSRLSIMKKAQMKESVKLVTTRKPPVLLQVRSKPATMVMVEPTSSESPWLRAREVADDSPATLERVKQMMRMKLVANARNIQELTEDWDKVICDYVDMSMLQEQLLSTAPRHRPLHHCSCICFFLGVVIFILV